MADHKPESVSSKITTLSLIPNSVRPFLELSRVEKPAGTAYLFMPCMFSTLLASTIATPSPDPSSVLHTGLLFFLGAAVMRGAGCTINDLYDRNLDKLVARTRDRPLARRAVSVPAAMAWAGSQCIVGLVVLLQFPTNTILMALPSMLLVCIYPLAKRVTHYPQFVLGCTFSWGAFLGFPAMGQNIVKFNQPELELNPTSIRAFLSSFEPTELTLGDPNVVAAAALLYASCISWTLLYDTIYAFQDIRDDLRAGIKSTAQAFSSRTFAADIVDRKPKIVLVGLGVLQTALLASSGYMLGLSTLFYALSCGGCAASLAIMILKVNLHNVASCAWWFKMGCWLTGGATGFGLLAEYYSRLTSDYHEREVASPTTGVPKNKGHSL